MTEGKQNSLYELRDKLIKESRETPQALDRLNKFTTILVEATRHNLSIQEERRLIDLILND